MDADLSALIDAADRGEKAADERLFAQLYSELYRVARRELARHGAPMSLGASSLLHEAYVDMAAREGSSFPDRARFIAYASRVMRGLIVEHARSRRVLKRGMGFHITALPTDVSDPAADNRDLERIGGAPSKGHETSFEYTVPEKPERLELDQLGEVLAQFHDEGWAVKYTLRSRAADLEASGDREGSERVLREALASPLYGSVACAPVSAGIDPHVDCCSEVDRDAPP